jgi:two-component system, LytTR family, response regulator LytT
MRVIIIEDERIALRKLKKLLHEIDAEIEIVAELESVYEAKKWFQSHVLSEIDLLFSDIQLSDGLSFEIFETVHLKLPVIFTTAFDEYALKAFKLNGVDYLLKPIQKEELRDALDKFKQTKSLYSQNQLSDIQKLINEFQQTTVKNPSFICFQNDRLIPIACGNVAYFYIQNLIVYAVVENTHYVLEETMDEIEKRLPQQQFFRANRQFIIQKKYILNAEIYFNNRLLVKLSIKTPEDIIISREKTTSFKSWLIGA